MLPTLIHISKTYVRIFFFYKCMCQIMCLFHDGLLVMFLTQTHTHPYTNARPLAHTLYTNYPMRQVIIQWFVFDMLIGDLPVARNRTSCICNQARLTLTKSEYSLLPILYEDLPRENSLLCVFMRSCIFVQAAYLQYYCGNTVVIMRRHFIV